MVQWICISHSTYSWRTVHKQTWDNDIMATAHWHHCPIICPKIFGRKFVSKDVKIGAKSPFWENLTAKLIFWIPIISTVGNVQLSVRIPPEILDFCKIIATSACLLFTPLTRFKNLCVLILTNPNLSPDADLECYAIPGPVFNVYPNHNCTRHT